MKNTMQYIIDDKGFKTSVIIPYSKWEKINSDYNKLRKKLAVLVGIKEGLNELKLAKMHGKELQTLSDFLNESNS